MYKAFTDLNLGFADAENYSKGANKELFSKYFVRDQYLERLLDPNIYFLVGEKGTGKTAYATFLRNTEYKNHKVSVFNVRQMEYQKFLELKRGGYLKLSSYADVWRTILLMTAATSILENSGTPEFLQRFTKIGSLKRAIDDFYQNAFAPEIVQMLGFLESSEITSKLIAKHLGLGSEVGSATHTEVTTSAQVFQTNLLSIRQAFEAALSGLKLDKDALIFIDGIDVRPSEISYTDYFECVRGLTEAIWMINSDFLGNIKDSKGRIRVVLLGRPDILIKTGIHNVNTKLRDNSVFLEWTTPYKDYRTSQLFKVADRLLAAQQSGQQQNEGAAWDYYFPFHAETLKDQKLAAAGQPNSFLSFMRFSYYRPRDINRMMVAMQNILKRRNKPAEYVSSADFNDPSFRDAHAEYLLGEIRDQLLFYYSEEEYSLFLQFFSHLRGKRAFTYAEYTDAFNEFIGECAAAAKNLPKFFESANAFLQFLYDQNVICFKELPEGDTKTKEPFIRWCFRERSLSNISPKIRIGVEYEIFYGLSKALNVGRRVSVVQRESKRSIGTVTHLDLAQKFGFLRGGDQHVEYYFKFEEWDQTERRPLKVAQRVSFEPFVKYGKPRAISIKRAD